MTPDLMFRPLPSAPLLPRSVVPFSQAADQHGVTPAAIDTLIDQLSVGIWITDRNGRVVFANAAARALCVDTLEELQWAITRALLTEEPVREDVIEIVTAGRPRRWVSAQVLPVRVAGRGVTGALVTLADVSARTRMRHWEPVIESLVNL